jgi:hypothetical protein
MVADGGDDGREGGCSSSCGWALQITMARDHHAMYLSNVSNVMLIITAFLFSRFIKTGFN